MKRPSAAALTGALLLLAPSLGNAQSNAPVQGTYVVSSITTAEGPLDILSVLRAGLPNLVAAHIAWTFEGHALTASAEQLLRAEDGTYWTCAAQLRLDVEWRDDGQLVVPQTVAATSLYRAISRGADGQWRDLDRECNQVVHAGTYSWQLEGDTLILSGAGAVIRLVPGPARLPYREHFQ